MSFEYLCGGGEIYLIYQKKNSPEAFWEILLWVINADWVEITNKLRYGTLVHLKENKS